MKLSSLVLVLGVGRSPVSLSVFRLALKIICDAIVYTDMCWCEYNVSLVLCCLTFGPRVADGNPFREIKLFEPLISLGSRVHLAIKHSAKIGINIW